MHICGDVCYDVATTHGDKSRVCSGGDDHEDDDDDVATCGIY